MQGLLHQKAHLAYIASHLPARLPSTGMSTARPASKGQPVASQRTNDENVSSNVEPAGEPHGSKPKKPVPRRQGLTHLFHACFGSYVCHWQTQQEQAYTGIHQGGLSTIILFGCSASSIWRHRA